MNEFISIESLGTLAGATAIVTSLVQVVKRYFVNVDPKWFVLGFSLILVSGYKLLTSDDYSNPINWLLAIVNGLVVTGTSIGAFEIAVKPLEAKK
jgi:hypothetical protein